MASLLRPGRVAEQSIKLAPNSLRVDLFEENRSEPPEFPAVFCDVPRAFSIFWK
jgi:hypothetical protein